MQKCLHELQLQRITHIGFRPLNIYEGKERKKLPYIPWASAVIRRVVDNAHCTLYIVHTQHGENAMDRRDQSSIIITLRIDIDRRVRTLRTRWMTVVVTNE